MENNINDLSFLKREGIDLLDGCGPELIAL
jgi:hypothetical protein